MKKVLNPANAFESACAKLRQMRSFSAAGEKILQHFADTVIEARQWTPVATNRYAGRTDLWMKMHSQTSYMKNPAIKTPLTRGQLREKLATDAAHDMGFPVATCAFYRHQSPQPNAMLRAVPCEQPENVMHVMKRTPGEIDDALPLFISAHSRVQASFAALNVAHLWLGFEDDHSSNFITSKQRPKVAARPLYAIDFEGIFIDTHHCHQAMLEQTEWMKAQPATPVIVNAVRAAVTAIENYPDAKLEALAKRLVPLSPEDPTAPLRDAKWLAQRKQTLRQGVSYNYSLDVYRAL